MEGAVQHKKDKVSNDDHSHAGTWINWCQASLIWKDKFY